MHGDSTEPGDRDEQLWIQHPSVPADVAVSVDVVVRSLAPSAGVHDTQIDVIERLTARATRRRSNSTDTSP